MDEDMRLCPTAYSMSAASAAPGGAVVEDFRSHPYTSVRASNKGQADQDSRQQDSQQSTAYSPTMHSSSVQSTAVQRTDNTRRTYGTNSRTTENYPVCMRLHNTTDQREQPHIRQHISADGYRYTRIQQQYVQQ